MGRHQTRREVSCVKEFIKKSILDTRDFYGERLSILHCPFPTPNCDPCAWLFPRWAKNSMLDDIGIVYKGCPCTRLNKKHIKRVIKKKIGI